jgi:drug/metabolite transporter (DMT)-like permease
MGYFFALLAAAAWAVGSVLFARIGRGTSPLAMSMGKSVFAGVLLTATGAALGLGSFSAAPIAYVWLLASALAGITIGDTAYFGAIVRIGVPRAIILLSSAPIFAAVLGAVFLDEHLGVRGAGGIAVTLSGIALAVWRREPAPASDEASVASASHPSSRGRVALGLTLGVVSGLGQATGSVLSKRAMALGIEPAAAGGLRLLLGGLALAAAAAFVGRALPAARELATNRAWMRVAGAALIGSFGGIWLSQLALQRTASVGVASTLLATSPIFALPLAHVLGQERVRPLAVVGAVVAVTGIALLVA